MSSLTNEKGSRTGYRLRVYTAAGRRSIWLGPIPERDAIAVQRHVDEIIASQTAEIPIPRQTQQWLERCDASLRSKLQCITGAARTVQTAIDEYLGARRSAWSDATYDSVYRSLDVLADACGVVNLTAIHADAVTEAHEAIELAPSTCGKIAKDWRAFFAWCVDSKWISENPARHLSTAIAVRAKTFIPADTIQRVVDACECPAMAVVIALSRWGGIRVSSEIRSLIWESIDRTAKRIQIIDTKRGCERDIPLFPEIAATLDRHGDGPLCGDILDLSHAEITRRFHLALDRCSVPHWPAPWHSMRASRETELITAFGLATAAKWIGNSEAVAMKSYALITNEEWARATSL
jgi:integrase